MESARSSEKAHNEKLGEEIKALTSECSTLLEQKKELQNEVLTASEYVVNLEDKCWQANKTSLDLLSTVKELETEIETLKGFIVDLKARAVFYIPVKNDPVDIKLAEYINSYPDRQKLKVMFQRELAGQYTFGTRRTVLKVERERLQCKAGGGYLLIDKFIEQYTPIEMEKIARKASLTTKAGGSRREGRTASVSAKPAKAAGTSAAMMLDKEIKAKYEISPTRHQFVPLKTYSRSRSGAKQVTRQRDQSTKRSSDTRNSMKKLSTARRSMLELLEEQPLDEESMNLRAKTSRSNQDLEDDNIMGPSVQEVQAAQTEIAAQDAIRTEAEEAAPKPMSSGASSQPKSHHELVTA